MINLNVNVSVFLLKVVGKVKFPPEKAFEEGEKDDYLKQTLLTGTRTRLPDIRKYFLFV